MPFVLCRIAIGSGGFSPLVGVHILIAVVLESCHRLLHEFQLSPFFNT